MKCQNCFNELISSLRCPYCPNLFCSLPCLESHYSISHNLNLFHKNEEKNNLYFTHSTTVTSPFLVKGILKTKIYYEPIYNLDNFIPIYKHDGNLKTIGSGSYGQVYLALNIITKKYYAIKHMDKKNIFLILNSLLNIQKEIDIQSKIEHPNIVKLLYVHETESTYDLIMEYAKGGNLFHYIRQNGGLSEDKSFEIFIQVVNAIYFLHENDLIHRDIKPENILIFENNVVKLCDFGWCVKLNGYQRGTFCGTTEYMSPELVNHQGYGKEIDNWSLGVLLYEMIHGYSPFKPNKDEFEPEDVMENIVNHNLKFKKQVSERCKKLIYGLLDSNIYNRYTVKDIFNSEFVKYYENIKFNNDMNKTQINNILYSPQIEMNNNINIHMNCDYKNYIYNIQIPERNKSYDFNSEFNNNNNYNYNYQKSNGGVFDNYIKSAKKCQNNISYGDFSENSNYLSNSNINNDNFYKNEIIKHDNLFENENKSKKLVRNKTENLFYPNDFIKEKEINKINEYSIINNNINYNSLNNEFINGNNNNFNSNNNYLYNNILDSDKENTPSRILKISYLPTEQFNENHNEKLSIESDKESNGNINSNYIFNNRNNLIQNNNPIYQFNLSKFSLIKKNPLNNISNELQSNLSFSSMKTPVKHFSDIQIQKSDHNFFINNSCIDINNQSNLKKEFNNEIRSRSIANTKKVIEKEPVDNFHKKKPPHKNISKIKGINISKNGLNNIGSTRLIKNNKKSNKNKEIPNVNNIFTDINFAKSKEIMNPKKNIIIEQKKNYKKDNIRNLKLLTTKNNNKKQLAEYNYISNIKIKKPKDKKITNYNHNPKDESMIYYKTEAKNNITETQEDNNLFNALETEINKESDKYPFNKKIIINKNKKGFYQKNIENNKHKTLNKKTSDKNKIIIKKEKSSLDRCVSEDNIIKFSNINKNRNNNNLHSKLQINVSKINNLDNLDNINKGKETGFKMKNGIKKIYVYNNQLKNIGERENEKKLYEKMKIPKNKNENLTNISTFSNENRIRRGITKNTKKYIIPFNKIEPKIINNSPRYNEVNEERNKTPEKKSIFNKVEPNLLIATFKKELEDKTNALKVKYNIIKK